MPAPALRRLRAAPPTATNDTAHIQHPAGELIALVSSDDRPLAGQPETHNQVKETLSW